MVCGKYRAHHTVCCTAQACYELEGKCYSTYGLEYKPGFDDAVRSANYAWRLTSLTSPLIPVHHMDPERDRSLDAPRIRHGRRHACRDQRASRPSRTTRTPSLPLPFPLHPSRYTQYIIFNLGISENFGYVDFDHLTFPTTMSVDWVRVYQAPDALNIGCDPKDFPTAAYISQYAEAYSNPNLTTWVDDYKQPTPKNSFLGQC